MHFQDMLQWWNLIYIAPLFVSLIWILATVVTGVHGHDLSHGDGIGHDVAHGVDHAAQAASQGVSHVVHDLAHSLEHVFHPGDSGGHDLAHGHDAAHAGHQSHHGESHAHGHQDDFFMRLLWLLGVGQVPITLLIGVFLLCWGTFGMLANQILAGILKYPAAYILPSMGITFVASSIITRSMAAIVGKFLPTTENYAISRFELIGSLGRTVYTTGPSTGTVHIYDKNGTVHRVQAKTVGDETPIPSATDVIVVDFDDTDKRFIVKQSTL